MENNQNSHGSKRVLPPAHFSLKIESFPVLQKTGVEKYESDVFEAGGYKWRLCLYPNGKSKGNPKGNRFVSLYLKLENTGDLPRQWEVNAEFKLFVFDHINKKYLTVQDKNHPVKRFHEKNTEEGFDILPLETFRDSSEGYLVKDCCVFGAEVFVIKPTGKREVLSMLKKPANGFSTWKIPNFSKLDKNSILCKAFTAGGRSWQIQVHPGGYDKGKGNSLSVFLDLVDRGKLPPKKAIWAEYKLRVLDQCRDKHVEYTCKPPHKTSLFIYITCSPYFKNPN
ncbi:TRAF-LIKE FAMILY PROTEIN [Salix koriyanagi]|uniref:TRAF-LIKE FAMILY PROTEIN n=1 Tax=Salix koriyanagi TaxID=2511006 RepID=A0A9Q0U3D0_9ROSI|nr:TRAF-LIKE FAMILY PROTEIN [Salix koriyanagi]